MKLFRRAVRFLLLTIFIVLASFSAAGMFAPNFRDRYQNKQTRIEWADRKEDEAEEDEQNE